MGSMSGHDRGRPRAGAGADGGADRGARRGPDRCAEADAAGAQACTPADPLLHPVNRHTWVFATLLIMLPSHTVMSSRSKSQDRITRDPGPGLHAGTSRLVLNPMLRTREA